MEKRSKMGQCQYKSDQFNWNSNIIPNSSLSVPTTTTKMVCGNCFQVWRGSFKFTSQHALFIARNHPSERGKALFDYWMGRVLVFVAWFAVYVLFSRYAISDRPQHEGETFHAMDVDLTPTRFFYGLFAAFGIFAWSCIFKPELSNDARLMVLPNALPPRFPIIAHFQVFWRDYYRIPAQRAFHRLETLTNAAQGVAGDAGLTRYWLTPWSPPIVYVSHPRSIRDMFMLEEFIEVYIDGRACRCLPKTLIACGFGHPLNLLNNILIQPESLAIEARIVVQHSRLLTTRIREHPTNKLDLLVVVCEVVLDSICSYACGSDFKASQTLREYFDVAVDGAASVLAAPPPSFPCTSWFWKFASFEGRSIAHAAKCIAQKLTVEVQRRRRRMDDASESFAKPVCLVDYMLIKYPSAKDDEIVEDIVAFMVQRYSVLVPGVVWSIHEILKCKKKENIRLLHLIRSQGKTAVSKCKGKTSSSIETLDLEMPTLERCVREALRLHPPAPALAPLTLLKNVKLSGYGVKAKSEIRLMPYMTQRSAKYWKGDDELLFDEGRWKHQRKIAQPAFSHYAFGAGLLTCATPESARKSITHYCWNVFNEFNMSIDDDTNVGAASRTSILLPPNGLIVRVQV